MTILVTGASGTVGSEVVKQLVARGAAVRAMTRTPDKMCAPQGVDVVKGDLLEPASIRTALEGIRTLFLLAAVSPAELNQTINALGLAREAGVERVVYLSVIHAERFCDVPHFASKEAVERMIHALEIPTTILRPTYYIQNEAGLKAALLEHGVYPMALGTAGTLMVDTRDLGEIAALELLRRDRSPAPLPIETLVVTEPELHTGPGLARIWADALGREVHYGGDDLDVQEQGLLQVMPDWMAYDMRLMICRFQRDGMHTVAATDAKLQWVLGRPMRSYRQFAADCAEAWGVAGGAGAGAL